MNLFELTKHLIDTPSVTGEEIEVVPFLSSYLKNLGYRVELQEVQGGSANIISTTKDRPRIVLSTHMDTVQPHIASSEDDENIYGQGACEP
jgi:acetylornithine deacetylase